MGRPRSEASRQAVLRAVDNLLVEEGYAAMTMRGIAARAGVGRQTVYRWWSSKAEILLEASIDDAAEELATAPGPDSVTELTAYVQALVRFLTSSHAGLAYRALLGEAQHDQAVAELVRGGDVLGPSARAVLARAASRGDLEPGTDLDEAVADFIGPVLFRVLLGNASRPREDWLRYVLRFLARHG
jgi:AcrR family transcriptional regulator